MTTSQKVKLTGSVVGEYSLSSALAAVELPKSTWYYHQRQKVDYGKKYARLQPALEEIARRHSEYGYRRTTTELHETYQERVNHKVVQRLHAKLPQHRYASAADVASDLSASNIGALVIRRPNFTSSLFSSFLMGLRGFRAHSDANDARNCFENQ
jgi:hypothetical protein